MVVVVGHWKLVIGNNIVVVELYIQLLGSVVKWYTHSGTEWYRVGT